jgi:hypothetical protein
MNKRSSKAMMIVLFIFLLLATTALTWELEYQIGKSEIGRTHIQPHYEASLNESIESHDSEEKIESHIIYKPIAKVYKAAQIGVVTVLIGFIIFAIYCIRRKLYGRMEVVTFILSMVCWVAMVLLSYM